MKTRFAAVPQRSNGVKYVNCPIERATSWAVVRINTRQRGGHTVTIQHTLSRYARRSEAELDVLSHERGAAGPLRRYGLGKRMEKANG